MNKKRICSLLNIAIIVLEIVGFTISLVNTGRIGIEWYTEESNLLALVAAVLYLAFMTSKKKMPEFVRWIKYTAALGLLVTFLVTAFVLAPMYNFNYGYLFFHGNLFYHHLICPLLAVLAFVRFDEIGKISKEDTKKSMIWTAAYAVLMIVLNIVGVIEGPYPFLMVLKQPVYMSVIWFFAIVGSAFGLSTALRKIKNRQIK